MSNTEILRPDSKGRITLGALAKGVSSFHVKVNKDNTILLEPYTEIPVRERWLFEDKKSLSKLKHGLKDVADGNLSSMGDFTKYVDK